MDGLYQLPATVCDPLIIGIGILGFIFIILILPILTIGKHK